MIVRARGSRIRNAESRSWRVVATPGEHILWIFREHAIVDISISMVCIECENTGVVPRNQPSVVLSYSMCVIFVEAHFDFGSGVMLWFQFILSSSKYFTRSFLNSLELKRIL
jgi:hypothetical protein